MYHFLICVLQIENDLRCLILMRSTKMLKFNFLKNPILMRSLSPICSKANFSGSTQKVESNIMDERILEADKLYRDYPPSFSSKSKLVSFKKAQSKGYKPWQKLRVTRWRCLRLPETYSLESKTYVTSEETVFQYRPRVEDESLKEIDWHLNFADVNLFFGYAGGLLAQDELQVLECPILASVREFLKDRKVAKEFDPITIKNHQPSPILIANADRVINIDTFPDPSKDRPRGLYGQNFHEASQKTVELATNILYPPNRVNIIAIAAPACGVGFYTKEEIMFILNTCYTGFYAAKRESLKVSELLREEIKSKAVVEEKMIKTNIFTGFWGCGAFGGNRELMVILQIIGAHLAGIDSLTIHTVHKDGTNDYKKALSRYEKIMSNVKEEIKVTDLVVKLVKDRFEWGFSNGT